MRLTGEYRSLVLHYLEVSLGDLWQRKLEDGARAPGKVRNLEVPMEGRDEGVAWSVRL